MSELFIPVYFLSAGVVREGVILNKCLSEVYVNKDNNLLRTYDFIRLRLNIFITD